MDTIVEVIITGDEEKGYQFNIPHLPIKVGQQLTLDIDVRGDKWIADEENITVEVEGVDYYIRDSYSDSGRINVSIQTLYCKIV